MSNRYHSSRVKSKSSACAASRIRSGCVDPITGRILLGCFSSHASATALRLARAMKSMATVTKVLHPLLEDSPSFRVASRLLPDGAGGMMAFDVNGGRESVQRMIKRFQLATFAASLGGVETTISYPEITSHRSMSAQERAELGVGPGTVRVSVGIEDPDDIVADFTQALA